MICDLYFQAVNDVWTNKVELMDQEVVLAMQNFCNIFERQSSRPDRLFIANIPHLVDLHYSADPIRSDIVKSTYKSKPVRTRIVDFRDYVDDKCTEVDSLLEATDSNPEDSADAGQLNKAFLDSPLEFSDEEMSCDSLLTNI